LHQAAELDGPREIVRRGDHKGKIIAVWLKPDWNQVSRFWRFHDRPPVTYDVT
jgi:hypothetical protein